MSDEEREPTPGQEAAISRLLADARATEPLPAEVAARLDRVLVGLGEERAGAQEATPGQVLALASRRRRASVLLVAAAAVVAVGVGLGQVVGGLDTTNDDSGAASESSAQGDAERGQDQDKNTDSLDAGGAVSEKAERDGSTFGESLSPASIPATVGRVRKASFTADANQLRRAIADDAVDGQFVDLAADQLPRGYVLRGRAFDCAPASWGEGVLVPVFFDGTPAVLAYRPAAGDSQVVDLVQCGSGDILGSTTLPAG